ncbi:MAG: amino acid ABC transporter permease [Bdellovibrionales bacterium]|nr:amino acid ABC transporter permease [Bdellovibrionales bacterium]
MRSPISIFTQRQIFQSIKEKLFKTPWHSFISLILIYLIFKFFIPFFNWAIIDASFIGESRSSCHPDGACWVFIAKKINQFIYGFYPEKEIWRLNLVFIGFFLSLVFLKFVKKSLQKSITFFLLLGFPILSFILLRGGFFGLTSVDTSSWGGLSLTLIIAAVGIVGSLPLGILLALGRRSTLPVIKTLCILFIEFWRGVPLITVLFMSSVMLPLFLPEGINIDKLLRALIGVVLFSSAYMAEVIRGGLQGLSKGQYEASEALGLNYWKKMRLVILPQALRLVIPGIVNTFIGLFKDTTLVLVIGLFDLLGMVQAATTDPEWLGYSTEGYLFAGFGFWIFCFAMSRFSHKLETNHVNPY